VRDNPNGPAVIYTNGNLEYWVQGKCELIRNTKSFQKNDEQAAQNSCFRNQLVSHSSMADIIKARLERNPFPGPLAADDRSKETTTTTTTPKSHFNPGVNFLHDGTEVWVDDDGEYHRDGDLPAIILPDGTVLYYYHGDQHRVGGAAVLRADGSYEFFFAAKLHRPNGVAKCDEFNTQFYYFNGLLHRTDGPAVIYKDGRREWHIHGVFYYAAAADEEVGDIHLTFAEKLEDIDDDYCNETDAAYVDTEDFEYDDF
jgi:hypothetical protein